MALGELLFIAKWEINAIEGLNRIIPATLVRSSLAYTEGLCGNISSVN